MSIRQCLSLSLLVVACNEPHVNPVPTNVSKSVNFGVSIAGAEFGSDALSFCNESPGVLGKDYFHNEPWTYNWFQGEGVDLFRIPFRWERIQPVLGGPLNKVEIERITSILEWAHKKDVRVILDLHNFGRYKLRHQGEILGAVINKKYQGEVLVKIEHLVDLWVRIIRACDSKSLEPWALGLMNEPHDMGFGNWRKISKKVVADIRASGSEHALLVAGDGWSSAENWKKNHGSKTWIDDPLDKIIYEAHVYFDFDGAGKYG
ncbi:MAG: cellulase family glycosylhydrolase, partial [Planctomycetota bacterium]|nr:cellulase family glycosylhydrolase [Planctomycetota bacterium]